MSPIKMQKAESAIRLVVELLNAENEHDIEGIVRLVNDKCILEDSSSMRKNENYKGKEEIGKHFQELFSKRKNILYQTEELVGFGHRCILRYKSKWIDEEGKEVTERGMDSFKEENETIIEILSYIKSK
jgi:ketosteroid isomerase-like protein